MPNAAQYLGCCVSPVNATEPYQREADWFRQQVITRANVDPDLCRHAYTGLARWDNRRR